MSTPGAPPTGWDALEQNWHYITLAISAIVVAILRTVGSRREVHQLSERVAVVETESRDSRERLERIENKVDQLLSRGHG